MRYVSLTMALALAALAAAVIAEATSPRPSGRITFARVTATVNYEELSEIYVMDADGTHQRRLTRHRGDDAEPAWSPDGRRIAFTRDLDPGKSTGWYIHVMNADGSGVQRITKERFAVETDPSWSPDGRRLAYTRYSLFTPEIAVIGADGRGLRILTNIKDAGSIDPAWSPDGRRIVFATTDGDIYVMSAQGTRVRRLVNTTDPLDKAGSPAWSPDGRRIAFNRLSDLWLMNADGTGQRRLTSRAASGRRAWDPAWSPDGGFIAVADNFGEEATSAIYVMTSAGTAARLIARNGTEPAWTR